METNVKQMKCGGCGEELHRIFQLETGELVSECIKCKSRSKITVKPARVEVEWMGESLGTLCVWGR